MRIEAPYLLFLGDARDELAAKTARGIVDWRPERCVAQLRLPGCKADLGLPDMTVAQATAEGARTLVLGVVNAGGELPESWWRVIIEALEAGLDVASGMHQPLWSVPEIGKAAKRTGRRLIEVRIPHESFATGRGTRRAGKRLLTVGTDCSVGKMYATLALEKEMKERGLNVDFRATGQSGILITGEGVAVDAVVADFISGATEWLTPENDPDHWDLVEGQGSLFHPSYAGVSLGLLHGAQPDALVLCHEPTRDHMRGLPDQPLPDLRDCIEANVQWAHLTNPDARCIGLAVNTSALAPGKAAAYLEKTAAELALPCVDPMTTGTGPLVEELLRQWPN